MLAFCSLTIRSAYSYSRIVIVNSVNDICEVVNDITWTRLCHRQCTALALYPEAVHFLLAYRFADRSIPQRQTHSSQSNVNKPFQNNSDAICLNIKTERDKTILKVKSAFFFRFSNEEKAFKLTDSVVFAT